MKKFFMWGLGLFLLTAFVSCNDDDTTPVGYGDAYIVSKYVVNEDKSDSILEYELYMYAYGYYGTLSSVEVTAGLYESYTLTKNSSGTYTYESGFSTELPYATTYTFQYTFDTNEIITTTDDLTEDVLEPTVITSCVYADNEIDVDWEAVSNADAYEVSLTNSEGDVVFRSTTSSGYLSSSVTSYSISSSSGTWTSGYSMEDGTYTVSVVALMADSRYYFQAESIASAKVVWGEDN